MKRLRLYEIGSTGLSGQLEMKEKSWETCRSFGVISWVRFIGQNKGYGGGAGWGKVARNTEKSDLEH